MKLYREYEEAMIKALGILGAILTVVLFITLLAKFAIKIVVFCIMLMAIMLGLGGLYLGICTIIDYKDFNEKFGLK